MSRASQVHQVPQIGLAQIGPVVSMTALNATPTSADDAAKRSSRAVVEPEVERAAESHQREGEQRGPRGGHVEVEDLLRQPLPGLDRRVAEGEHVDAGEREERDQR